MLKTIIMAAGEGTRMRSSHSKLLHKLLNREIIKYVVDAANIKDSEILLIGGKNKDSLEDMFSDIKVIEQKIGDDYPYGTGYATSLALDYIDDDDEVLVLNGDIPLITNKSLSDFVNSHKENDNNASVLSIKINNPKGYGRIIRDENENFIAITEDRDLLDHQKIIDEINTGIYIFKASDLKESIKKISTDNTQNELYLTDLIKILSDEGKKVMSFLNDEPDEFYGINNKKELSEAQNILRKRINDEYMVNGVIIDNPSITFIEPGVIIGEDTIISGSVKIIGNTKIGKNCIIEGSCRIEDSTISDNVKIDNSVIEKSFIDENTDIGPYSHLRPNSKLGKDVHIGNFVEVKNSNVGDNTKAGHLAYIGDADLGKDINVGCGVIFVNYDGKFKHRSKIYDRAFIGSNSNIVAPVEIKEEGYIAAGSTITEDVDEGNLSIERSKQLNIAGYVEKKKKKDLEKIKEKK